MVKRFSQPALLGLSAKGLFLTAVCTTSALSLLSPNSLTAAASLAPMGDAVSLIMFALSLVGWADVVYTDTTGRLLLPAIPQGVRHRLCTSLYSSISGLYLVLAFTAVDLSVHTSWILFCYYVGTGVFGAVFSVSVAMEGREEQWAA
jgi:hypothetical protein